MCKLTSCIILITFQKMYNLNRVIVIILIILMYMYVVTHYHGIALHLLTL